MCHPVGTDHEPSVNSNAGFRNDDSNFHNYHNHHRGVLDAIAEVSDESRASTPQGGIAKITKTVI